MFPDRVRRLDLEHELQTEVLGVTVTMLCSIAILRMFKVHMPPALAVGLIPFVIVHPTISYPISVLFGAAALIVSTRAYSLITHQSGI
jgi:ABC-type polysaccharide/polyol phosphate export permease